MSMSTGRRRAWFIGTWNVRSLVDTEGSIETARLRSKRLDSEDRKIDLVIRELNRYNIKIAALQETKWFGSHVYHIGKSTVLTAGRNLPQEGQPRTRGEGVAIVLTGHAITAWRAGGEQWKSWGSRIVKASLGVKNKDTKTKRMHIISCYAPTFAASRAEKDAFFDQLQEALNEIPSDETYIVLGDFNARLGSRTNSEDSKSRGPHGIGELNCAGKELLDFLSLNEATACNTWFKKKDIHKHTWQHPKSKKWHCIDYAITRSKDRRRCLDASVKRGAECNTDHQLLRIKMSMTKLHQAPKPAASQLGFAVSKLAGPSLDENGENTPRGHFQELVSTLADEQWKMDGTISEKWTAIRSALTKAAESALGNAKRRHPDWFRENAYALEPIFQERNRLYTRWLGSGCSNDKRKFAQARSEARQAARAAKNAWFTTKAEEAQLSRFGGKKVWKCIRDMQYGRRGLVPARLATVTDEEGNPCTTAEAQQQRWRRHFSKILNIQSQFKEDEIMRAKQRPIRQEIAEIPTEEELIKAVSKLKSGKAGGSSGILPEMIKAACCDEDFLRLLLDLVQMTWRECEVPQDWSDALLIPIPKKGTLSKCDNWRGIALLDVVGKVAARIVQERLQIVAEEELPESQCGFRKGRGCSDMVFTVRQLVENLGSTGQNHF